MLVARTSCGSWLPEGGVVLELAIAALVIGLIASVLGFTSIAGASFAVARIVAWIFLLIFVVLLVLALVVGVAIF